LNLRAGDRDEDLLAGSIRGGPKDVIVARVYILREESGSESQEGEGEQEPEGESSAEFE
jgi:hypothetical protein